MSKKRGSVWIAIGLLLLLGAAGLSLYNLHLDAEAGKQSDAVAIELVEVISEVPQKAPIRNPNADYAADLMENAEEPEPVPLDGRYYMGMVTFPTLGLQLPVQHEWSYPNLRVSPCRMTGGILTEDLVILAHNYRTHFGPLNRIGIGDEVSLMTPDGGVYVYKVSAKEIVEPTAVTSVTSGEWPLTLFTCTLGGQTRFVVRCDWAD